MPRLRDVLRLLAGGGAVAVLASCGGYEAETLRAARPVVVQELREETPPPAYSVVGVVEPYREASVGFEVAGRLDFVLDAGRTVEVRTHAAPDGSIVSEGEVLASIDPTTYRQRLTATELKLESAAARRAALVVDLEQVAPATVARAKAQRDAALANVEAARATVRSAQSARETAQNELNRSRPLYEQRKISEAEFDATRNNHQRAVAEEARAQAGLEGAQKELASLEAAVSEVSASLQLKAENVATVDAEIRELENARDQARTDVERCTLRAPFSGRITAVHVSQGDFASPGAPVVTLTLIDPMKVSVTVSSRMEREIQPGSHAYVTPDHLEDYVKELPFLVGTVFEKAAVADAATRTYRIDVMVRNARRASAHEGDPDLPRVGFREFLPVVERDLGAGGPLYACRDCIVKEGAGHAVYRIKGIKFGLPGPADFFRRVLEVERIPVVPQGRDETDFLAVLNWTFQQVAQPQGAPALANGDLILSFAEGLDPSQVQRGVVRDRIEWALRPGDLVPVSFHLETGGAGFYVPATAIVQANGRKVVYRVADDQAEAVPVELAESRDDLWRITGAGLSAGDRIVVRGAHYCFDGAPVKVSEAAPSHLAHAEGAR